MPTTHKVIEPMIGLLIILTGFLQGAEVTLGWNPNPEPEVAGYRVLYGLESNSYTRESDAGNETEIQLPNLLPGRTYYAVVLAYSSDGIGSPLSEEINFTLPPTEDAPFAELSEIRRSVDAGNFEMTLTGVRGTVATLQTSSNLRYWTDSESYTLGDSPVTVIAPQSDSDSRLYYRVSFH